MNEKTTNEEIMNLYEALKAGSSSYDLWEDFQTQLSAAQKKLDEELKAEKEREKLEKEKEKKDKLNNKREELIATIVDYADTVVGEDNLSSTFEKDVKAALVSFEEEMKNILAVTAEVDKLFSNCKKSTSTIAKKDSEIQIRKNRTDGDIINDFLKSFR